MQPAKITLASRALGAAGCYNWGERYEQGRFVKKNRDKAMHWYSVAAALGSKEAYLKIGDLHCDNNELVEAEEAFNEALKLKSSRAWLSLANVYKIKNEIKKMCKALSEASKLGEQAAINTLNSMLNGEHRGIAGFYLGQMHQEQQDYSKGIDNYKISAASGYVRSMEVLGDLFSDPNIGNDKKQGFAWYKEAAENLSVYGLDRLYRAAEENNTEGMLALAKLYDQAAQTDRAPFDKIEYAVEYYEKLGTDEGYLRLGQLYEKGLYGLERDLKKAFKYSMLAAMLGKAEGLRAGHAIELMQDDQNFSSQLALYYGNHKEGEKAIRWYKKAADQGDESAHQQIKIIAGKTTEYAYLAGTLYETESVLVAMEYYIQAALRGHYGAKTKVEGLAKNGGAEVQFRLATNFYHQNKEFERAVDWCVLATAAGHKGAKAYLENTLFPANIYMKIAQIFKEGIRVSADSDYALTFYKKASDAGNDEASYVLGEVTLETKKNILLAVKFYEQVKRGSKNYSQAQRRLAEIYENGFDEVPGNKLEAASCYIEAMTYNLEDVDSPEDAKRLVSQLINPKISYKLGVGFKQRNETIRCLKYLKEAADKNYQQAIRELDNLSKGNGELAFELGKLYEDDDFVKALDFFKIALQEKEEDCVQYLEKMAINTPEAMLILAQYYYIPERKYDKAVEHLMYAVALDHEPAIIYLKGLSLPQNLCLKIAETYETGEGVHRQNLSLAVAFRIKTLNINEVDQLMRLAGLCESDEEGFSQSQYAAWEYYAKAVQLNSEVANFALRRLTSLGTRSKNETVQDGALAEFQLTPCSISQPKRFSIDYSEQSKGSGQSSEKRRKNAGL